MKFLSTASILLAATPLALGKEIRDPPKQERYVSGDVHNSIMDTKMANFAHQRSTGKYDSIIWDKIQTFRPCKNGYAGSGVNTTFRCKNIDLRYFLSHAELGSTTGEGSSTWGWTAPGGREFIIIGQADGAAFAEVTIDGRLDYLGRLPNTQGSLPAIWRGTYLEYSFKLLGYLADLSH